MTILILQTWNGTRDSSSSHMSPADTDAADPKPPFEKQGFGTQGLLGHYYKGKEHGHYETDPLLLPPENNIHHFNSHFSGKTTHIYGPA